MKNVAMHQNGVYTHDINKLLASMTTKTIGASVEAEQTSQRIRYFKTNFQFCSNKIQYTLQRVDIWEDCNVTVGIWRAVHVLPPPLHLSELLSARIFANE